MKFKRKYPVGAELAKSRGVHFRVWAPRVKKVYLCIEGHEYEMHREKGGYFFYYCLSAKEGTLYFYRLGRRYFADPASRYQPEGVNGPSMVINPHFPFKKRLKKTLENQIIYELHIGTFTKEGTFKAAIEKLKYLKELGVTLLEIMPVHQFPGRFGWGYDGVNLFAPYNEYGHPNDLKKFIEAAHQLNIRVMLDVVYNHLGPEGNQLSNFSSHYLSKDKNEWGECLNCAHPGIQEYVLTNVQYWFDEFNFDGLRLDATPWIFPQEFLGKIGAIGKKKKRLLFAENEKQDVSLIHKYHFDAIFNEDFHHSMRVRLTGKRDGYLIDYQGSAHEFLDLVKFGFLYQGQYYSHQKLYRGTPSFSLRKEQLAVFIENHDQVANISSGLHCQENSDPGIFRALLSFFLLSPNTPLIFQGLEFQSSSPFYYFADHETKLSQAIWEGRKKFMSQFATQSSNAIPNPSDLQTFLACKIDWENKNEKMLDLFKDLIRLRTRDPVFKLCQRIPIEGSILNQDCIILRYFGIKSDRLICINFGTEYHFEPQSAPLLAPPVNQAWKLLWSSSSSKYGGTGVLHHQTLKWIFPGHTTIILGV